LRKLQAVAKGKFRELGEGMSFDEVTCLKGSNGKYEIHLNMSSLLGCFFNFGSVPILWPFLSGRKIGNFFFIHAFVSVLLLYVCKSFLISIIKVLFCADFSGGCSSVNGVKTNH
jgi:hypothetical protein